MRDTRHFGQLLRVLGFAFGLAVVVGAVIGQGILRTPGIVAGALIDPWLIMGLWALGAVVILIDACAVVELGTSIPRAGGPYALARRAYGHIGGTVAGWADWINSTLVIAFLSVVFAEYCQRLGIGAGLPMWVLSTGLIAVCWAINWTGTRISGAAQTVLSAAKGLMLLGLVLALFLLADPQAAGSVPPATTMSPLTGAALLIAAAAVMNTYAGWVGSLYFGEEIVAPARNIARATFGGILLVAALYLAVNAALLHVLSPAQMAGSELPMADAAALVFGERADQLITILSLVSVGAIANLFLMTTTRVGFAMARDRVLPRFFERTAASGTPRPALTLCALVAAAAAASGTYEEIVAATVPLTSAIVAGLDLAAIIMRRKEPDLPRPFKMPLYPWPAIIGLLINSALLVALVIGDPRNSSIGVGAAIILGLGYAWFGRGSDRDRAESQSA